ncbi:MAG: UvrD-helicase domain-containing protein [Chlorobi bacterium]|nr:UvrD-helicase domain-containing protein [Chlorobiota bacterium]
MRYNKQTQINQAMSETPSENNTNPNARMIIASAGSGKTYYITQEVIKEINNAKSIPHLLAILRQILIMTFTNKATDELRQRVIDELKQQGGDLYNTFLFHHRNLTISTIDSLLYEIIKPLLLLVKKDNPANLIVNEEEIVSEVAERLLVKAITERDSFGDAIHRIFGKKMEEGKKINLNDEIARLVNQYLTFRGKGIEIYKAQGNEYEELKKIIENWIRKFRRELYKEVIKTAKGIAKVYEGLLNVDFNNVQFKKKYKFDGRKNKSLEYLRELRNANPDCDEEEVEKWFDGIKKKIGNNTAVIELLWQEGQENPKEAIKIMLNKDYYDFADTQWRDEYNDLAKPVAIPKEIFEVLDFIEKDLLNAVFEVNFWSQISQTVKDVLTDHYSILLKDIPQILKNLLEGEGGNLPYVYEYTGSRFVRYFTDEFQDTSLPQYEALKPLWQEALSQGGEVSVVGDIKQSIYQWRDADPLIMAIRFPNDFNPAQKTLPHNWRSSPVIVEFNNHVFSEIIPQKIKEQWKELIDYQNSPNGTKEGFNLGKMLDEWYSSNKVKQNAQRDYSGSIVVRQLIVSGSKKSSLKKSEKQTIIIEDVIRVIHELVDKKGFQCGDITILFRKGKTLKIFATELLSKGYPVRVTTGIALKYDPASIVMIKILEGLFHKKQTGIVPKLIMAEISSLLCKVVALTNQECANKIFEKLQEIQDHLWTEKESFSSLTDMALAMADKFMDTFPELRSNSKWTEGLQAFLNFVRMTERKGINALQDLLKHWESSEPVFDLTEDDDLTSQNQISLMTIHKAKGLQNKIILIPDLYDWQFEIDNNKGESVPMPVKAIRKFLRTIDSGSQLFEQANDNEYLIVKIPSDSKLTNLKRFGSVAGEKYGLSEIISTFAEAEARHIFETLNLLYVGFTRPEQALFLWTIATQKSNPKEGKEGNDKNKNKSGKFKSGEDLVQYLITNPSVGLAMNDEPQEFQMPNDITVQIKLFVKGEYENLRPHSESQTKENNVQRKDLGKNQVWKAYPNRYFDVNLPINKTTVKDFQNFPIVQGTYLHKLVAQVKTIDDIDKLNIDYDHKEKLKEWLGHEELRNLKNWEVQTEVPLFHNKQMFYVDRIYTSPDKEVVIVDLKSADRPSQSPYWKKWEEQVRTYAEILKQQGHTVKSAYVVGFKEAVPIDLET